VGVDIDPERITDSKRVAKEYGVEDKVTWREGDVLKQIDDLEEASVVLLYMGDDIGRRLAPILQKRLKPGSRVVSHRFKLGDWDPDKTITVDDPTRTNSDDMVDLHLWTIKEEKEGKEKP
jgi:predicted O-methyltransferase YrrM